MLRLHLTPSTLFSVVGIPFGAVCSMAVLVMKMIGVYVVHNDTQGGYKAYEPADTHQKRMTQFRKQEFQEAHQLTCLIYHDPPFHLYRQPSPVV